MGWLNDLIVRIKGDSTQLDGTLTKTQSSVGGWAKKVAGFIAGAFAIKALVNFANKTSELYDVQAKAEQSLLVALKGREDIQQALISQAGELQKKTLFGDEQSIAAASRLAMIIGQDRDALQKLLPLVADLAQAKFEGNIVTAADMVAKSVGSSTNALARYGIQIEGDVGSAERLESAMEGLNRQVGGQAEAAAKVGRGAITQLSNAWGDFKETIGKVVTENKTLNKLITSLTEALYKINEAAGSKYAGMSKEELTAQRDILEAKKEELEAQDGIRQDINDQWKWYQKFSKAARDNRAEIVGIHDEYDKVTNDLEEINELLAKVPPPGSTGEIITGKKTITRAKAINPVSTSNLTMPTFAGPIEAPDILSGTTAGDAIADALQARIEKWGDLLEEGKDMLVSQAEDMVEGLFAAMSSSDWSNFGKKLLEGFASFLSTFGRLLVAFALSEAAFTESSKNPLSWPVALAAGLTAIAIAGLIKGAISRASSSIEGGGGGGGTSYGAGTGTPAKTSTTPQTIIIKVEGELRGQDIYWSGKRYAQEYGNGT